MCMGHDHSLGSGDHRTSQTQWWKSRWPEVVLGLLTAALSYFLWTEHRSHIIAVLPFALFLTCPLMHLFMHRGHNGHRRAAVIPKGDAVPRQPRQ